MAIKLLPCPFCGGSASFQSASDGANDGGHYVECLDCGASTNLQFGIKCVKSLLAGRWNRRIAQHFVLREIGEWQKDCPCLCHSCIQLRQYYEEAVYGS